MDDEDWGPVRKGFEFGLNFGVYQASHNPAQLYGGYTTGGSSLDNYFSLGNNQVELLSIPGYFERFYTQAQNVQNALNWSSPIEVYSYPFQMRYNPSMMFGLKGTLFFNPETQLYLVLMLFLSGLLEDTPLSTKTMLEILIKL